MTFCGRQTTRKRLRHYLRQLRRRPKATKFDKPPLVSICPRCGKPFSPDWNETLCYWSLCCEKCGTLNLLDMIFGRKPV